MTERLEVLPVGARFTIIGLPAWGTGEVIRSTACRVYCRFPVESAPRSFETRDGRAVTIPGVGHVLRDLSPATEVRGEDTK